MLHCSGETCLHQAATAGQLDSVKMLLAAGANPDLQCAKSGKTGEDNELQCCRRTIGFTIAENP